MTLKDMYFVFCNGECVYQCFTANDALKHIRRRLSGKKHADNKRHRWTYQRGLGPFRTRSIA